LIVGWISGDHLKGPETVSEGIAWIVRGASKGLSRRRRTTSVAWKMFAMSRVGALLLWLGLAKACAPQFDLHPKTVLFIMRYP
jgi:hypothetical protein